MVNDWVPVGVSDAGESEQVGLFANDPETEQFGESAVFHPSIEVYVTVCAELLPFKTDADAGEADIEKSGVAVTTGDTVISPIQVAEFAKLDVS